MLALRSPLYLCLDDINCHDSFITSVLSNLRWFLFPHPTSKISRSEARQAWAVTPELQGRRQRVLQRAGSLDHRDWHAELSQGPCLSQSPDTDEDTPHTHFKTNTSASALCGISWEAGLAHGLHYHLSALPCSSDGLWYRRGRGGEVPGARAGRWRQLLYRPATSTCLSELCTMPARVSPFKIFQVIESGF